MEQKLLVGRQDEQAGAFGAPLRYIVRPSEEHTGGSTRRHAGCADLLHSRSHPRLIRACCAQRDSQVSPANEQGIYAFDPGDRVDLVESLRVFDLSDDDNVLRPGAVLGHAQQRVARRPGATGVSAPARPVMAGLDQGAGLGLGPDMGDDDAVGAEI